MTIEAAKTTTKTTTKAKSKATAEPGIKPRFLLVEKKLIVQTSNGELALSLAMKFGALMELMNLEGANQMAEFDFLLNHIFSESELLKLRDLEWEETVEILMEYMSIFQKQVGASMGKFSGSSAL